MNLQLVYRYILSLSKKGNMFSEKKKQQKTKRPKKGKITSNGESQTPDHRRVQSTRYRLRHDS